jgi:guanylate kinase
MLIFGGSGVGRCSMMRMRLPQQGKGVRVSVAVRAERLSKLWG